MQTVKHKHVFGDPHIGDDIATSENGSAVQNESVKPLNAYHMREREIDRDR